MVWNIRNKLFTATGVIVLTLAFLVFINNQMLTTSVTASQSARNEVTAASLSTDIKIDVIQVWQWLTDISATRAAPGYDDGFAQAEAYAQKFQQDLQTLAQLRPDKKQTLNELNDSFEAFYTEGQEMARQYIAGGPALGNEAMGRFDGFATAMTKQLDTLVLELNQASERSLQTAVDQNIQVQRMSFWFVVITAVIATGVSALIARGIVSALKTMLHSVNRIATGDFEHRVTVKGRDELAEMGAALQQMLDYLQQIARAADQVAQGDLTVTVIPQSEKDILGLAFSRMVTDLRHLLGQVADTATTVGSASTQLASTSEQAGQATHQIAATIQQVAQGIQQQTRAVSQTATSIRQVSQVVEGVASGAQEQAQAVTQTSHAIDDLARAVQTIAHGAAEQAQLVAGAQTATTSLDSTVAQIARQTQAAVTVIQANLKTAQAGQQTAQEAVRGMAQLGQATDQLAHVIQDLGQRSGQIGAIIETIDDIAGQTNLLALNAAIEAARAGEQGKGFSVVADEVRKLAERSSQATKEIRDMIRAVQSGAEQAVSAMSQASSDVRQSVNRTQAAGSAFEAIAGGIGQVAGQVETTLRAVTAIEQAAGQLRQAIEAVNEVTIRNQALTGQMQTSTQQVVTSVGQVSAVVEQNTASTEEMAASAGEVSQAIDHIASVSEENTAAVEEVSASTDEMSAQVQEVSASAQALREMAQQLRTLVSRFKLDHTGSIQPALSLQPMASFSLQTNEPRFERRLADRSVFRVRG